MGSQPGGPPHPLAEDRRQVFFGITVNFYNDHFSKYYLSCFVWLFCFIVVLEFEWFWLVGLHDSSARTVCLCVACTGVRIAQRVCVSLGCSQVLLSHSCSQMYQWPARCPEISQLSTELRFQSPGVASERAFSSLFQEHNYKYFKFFKQQKQIVLVTNH